MHNAPQAPSKLRVLNCSAPWTPIPFPVRCREFRVQLEQKLAMQNEAFVILGKDFTYTWSLQQTVQYPAMLQGAETPQCHIRPWSRFPSFSLNPRGDEVMSSTCPECFCASLGCRDGSELCHWERENQRADQEGLGEDPLTQCC